MKKCLTLLLISALIASVGAQKVKVKSGVVTMDNNPVAKVVGDASMFKGIDLAYLHMNGDTLVKIKMVSSEYFIPTKKDIFWYDIVFHNPEKEMRYLIKGGVNYSEKKIAQWLFTESDPKIFNNGTFDQAAIDAFVAKNNSAEIIQAELDAYNEYERLLIERLKGAMIERDRDAGVSLRVADTKSFGYTTTTVFNIFQGDIKIGKLEKETTKSSTGTEVKYKIFRDFDPPLILGDSEKKYGLAAYTEMSNMPKLITIEDKKEIKPGFSIGENSQVEIVKFLVASNYL